MPPPEPIPDLLKAVNDASSRCFALWLSFLSVGTYLAIAIGTTTHLQLLVEGPVKLPLLGVDLPLFTFYSAAPPLFLVLHFYVLMQLYLLTRAVRQFDLELRAAAMLEADRVRVRIQLDAFVLTRLLLGGPDRFLPRFFLGATVWLTLLVGPVLLLLFFQLRFLPYHAEGTIWIHRMVLLLDLVMLWVVWPWLLHGVAPTRRGRAIRAGLGGLTGVLALFALGIATIPNERLEQWRRPSWWPTGWLFDGSVEYVLNISTNVPFSRNLVMIDVSPTGLDDEQVAKRQRTVSLRGRDLRRATLVHTDLRKADLSFTQLSDADLTFSDMTGANLHYANLTSAKLVYVKLTRAHLGFANMTSADLRDADLSGASLTLAALFEANLAGAILTGADLRFASWLTQAQLEAACGADAKLPAGLTLKPCPPKDPP